MTKKEEKKDYEKLRTTAESMFVNNNMTAREIAGTLNISEVTLSRWKKDDDWDGKRQFVRITPSRLRETLLREAEVVANGGTSRVDADAVVKLLAGADKLAGKATPDVVFSVLSSCCQYVATIDSERAARMADDHKLYLQHIIERAQ